MIEKLKQNIEALKAQKEDLIKNANLQIAQIEGAIQHATTLLDELSKEKEDSKEDISPAFKGLEVKKERKQRTKKIKTEE